MLLDRAVLAVVSIVSGQHCDIPLINPRLFTDIFPVTAPAFFPLLGSASSVLLRPEHGTKRLNDEHQT